MKPVTRRALLQSAASVVGLVACGRRVPRAVPSIVAAAPAPEPGGIFPDGRWNPARTWVFAVGILQWQDPVYAAFPTAARQDAEVVARLRARGVPSEQVVFLTDGDATREALPRALSQMVSRTRPGDLVWFYYAGHGVIDAAGTLYFVPHDAGDDIARTGWSLPSALDAIDARHRGPVLLTGDCCHSGAMAAAASASRANPCAALASSLSSEESTGTWTFTECLCAGLAGEVPARAAGPLTLRGLADFTIARMASDEEQLASFAAGKGFPGELVLGATTAASSDPRIGACVEARSGGAWYRARVVAAQADGRLLVHYGGYEHDQDELVAPDAVRPYTPTERPVGAAVDAEWHGRWYPATVLEARLGIHHVHYEGFGDEWNEWVSSRRVRPRRG